jgi:hypothetical protein
MVSIEGFQCIESTSGVVLIEGLHSIGPTPEVVLIGPTLEVVFKE